MAGMTDVFNRLSLALALWNGKDPILKERMFGLSGPEGNHGEDVKEYWWYLDAVPSSAWLRWRYHYPQAAFPYEDLVETNRARSKLEPEYELIDTGVFDDDRYWIVEVHYAKASPTDILMRITVAQPRARRPRRSTSCRRCGSATSGPGTPSRPSPSSARPRRPVDPGEPPRARATTPSTSGPARTGRGRRCSSARTRRTARGSTASRRPRRTRRTASTTTSSAAPRRSTRTASARRPPPGTG